MRNNDYTDLMEINRNYRNQITAVCLIFLIATMLITYKSLERVNELEYRIIKLEKKGV